MSGRGWLGEVGAAAATVLLAAALVYAGADVLVDPAALALGPGASVDEIERLRAAWGLDRPWALRLGERLLGLLRGDLGESVVRGRAVRGLVAEAIAPTLAYALPGTALATLVGLAGGIAAARRRGGASDRLALAAATGLMSVSSVVVVVALHLALAYRWGLFPLVGWPLAGSEEGAIGYVALPALAWALALVGPELRHYRAIFVRELAAPHLDGLRARGLAEARVLRRAIRGAAAPILARIAGRVPALVGGGVVVEYVFNIPGIGGLTIAALRTGDLPVLQGIAVAVATITVAGQVVADRLGRRLDPRVTAGASA